MLKGMTLLGNTPPNANKAAKSYSSKFKISCITKTLRRYICKPILTEDEIPITDFKSNLHRIEYEIGNDKNLKLLFNQDGLRVIDVNVTESQFKIRFSNNLVLICEYLKDQRRYKVLNGTDVIFNEVLDNPFDADEDDEEDD